MRVTDRESAAECIKENMILRKIARHCVEENGGLFISLPEDDLSYQNLFVESCRAAGIDAQVIDPAEARLIEPSVNPAIIGAVKVPDGSIDPFRLTLAKCHRRQGSRCESAGVSRSDRIDSRAGKSCRSHGT